MTDGLRSPDGGAHNLYGGIRSDVLPPERSCRSVHGRHRAIGRQKTDGFNSADPTNHLSCYWIVGGDEDCERDPCGSSNDQNLWMVLGLVT